MKKRKKLKKLLTTTFAFFTLSVLTAVPDLFADTAPVVKVTLLRLNDVYETNPVSGSAQGELELL